MGSFWHPRRNEVERKPELSVVCGVYKDILWQHWNKTEEDCVSGLSYPRRRSRWFVE